MEKQTRDYRIDGIKYFLIVLVIVGHYIEPSRYTNKVCLDLYSLIYFFHMPLFVMISGYFCGKQTKKKIKSFACKMMEIILVVLFGKYLISRPPLISLLFFGGNPLWFLLCLIYWKAYAYLLDKSGLSLKLQIIVSFVLAITSFCLINKYEGFLSISRAFQFLPYFSIGRWLHFNQNNPVQLKKRPSVLFIIISIILCIVFSCRELHLIEYQREGILSLSKHINRSVFSCFLFKTLYWFFSVILSVILLKSLSTPMLFKKNGARTLPIFVFQCYSWPFIVRYIDNFYFEILLSIISIVVFTFLAQNEKLSLFITNPISSILRALRRQD